MQNRAKQAKQQQKKTKKNTTKHNKTTQIKCQGNKETKQNM